MLETVLGRAEPAGSNQRGVTAEPWLYLLPSLDVRRVGTVGDVDPVLLQQLRRRGMETVPLLAGRGAPSLRDQLVEDRDIRFLVAGRTDGEARSQVVALVEEEPPVPVVLDGRSGVVPGADGHELAPVGTERVGATVVSRDDPHPAVLRCSVSLPGPSSLLTRGERVARRLARRVAPSLVPVADGTQPRLFAPVGGRRDPGSGGPVLVMPARASILEPPAYLRQAARRAGISLDGYRWRFAPARGFPSQKLLFVLEPGTPGDPTYIVKLPQTPAYNHRIANEYRALRVLARAGVASVPDSAFLDVSGDLLFLGQHAIAGAPLRRRWDGTLEDPRITGSVEWIVELGRRTLHPAAGSTVRTALEQLVGAYARLYGPTPPVRAALEVAVERLGGSAIPSVVQHGDLGNWNMLAHEDRVAVLDWESTEFSGMPLWDLYYFAQTLGTLSAERRGIRYRPGTFARQLLEDSALSRWLAAAESRYCEAVGVDHEAVDDAFHLCFVYHAVKEARRLSSDARAAGRYHRLVTLMAGRARIAGPHRLGRASPRRS